jgi:hypothetical protein
MLQKVFRSAGRPIHIRCVPRPDTLAWDPAVRDNGPFAREEGFVVTRFTAGWRSFLLIAGALVIGTAALVAQAPARGGQPAAGRGRAATAAPADRPATVLQVMRGILYPASNVIFYAQSDDPTKVKASGGDPSLATDPLASTYGGWEAVGNAAIALKEATRLLTIPRSCSDGKPAPIQGATWNKGLQLLRDAGDAAYKGAQAKNMDQMLDAADKMTTACSTCHEPYREKTPRCTP